jgi:hypothetical protein
MLKGHIQQVISVSNDSTYILMRKMNFKTFAHLLVYYVVSSAMLQVIFYHLGTKKKGKSNYFFLPEEKKRKFSLEMKGDIINVLCYLF